MESRMVKGRMGKKLSKAYVFYLTGQKENKEHSQNGGKQ